MISCRRLICMATTIKMQHTTFRIGMHNIIRAVQIEGLASQGLERKRRRKRIGPRSIQSHLLLHPCSLTTMQKSRRAIWMRSSPPAGTLRTGAFLKNRWREPQDLSRPPTKTTLSRRTHVPTKTLVKICQQVLSVSTRKDPPAQSVPRSHQSNLSVSQWTMSRLVARQAE